MFARLLATQKRGPPVNIQQYDYIANRKTWYFIMTAVKIYMFAIKFNIIHRFNTVKLL